MFYQFIRKGEVILSEIHEETESSQTKYKKTKTKERSVHQGHRERVKQRFLKHNLDVFEEHQILELLLFYGLPRADTNPIAHELLDRFGTISGVCDAPIEELTRTKGITQNVAILLKLIPQLSRHYINTQTSDKERIYDTNSAMRIISPQFIGRKNEMVVLVLMDSKNRVLYCGVVTEGNVNTVPLYIRKIITLAATYNAALQGPFPSELRHGDRLAAPGISQRFHDIPPCTIILLAMPLLRATRVSFTFTIRLPPISETTTTLLPTTNPRLARNRFVSSFPRISFTTVSFPIWAIANGIINTTPSC